MYNHPQSFVLLIMSHYYQKMIITNSLFLYHHLSQQNEVLNIDSYLNGIYHILDELTIERTIKNK